MPDTPQTLPVAPMASSMAIWVDDMVTMRRALPLITCPSKPPEPFSATLDKEAAHYAVGSSPGADRLDYHTLVGRVAEYAESSGIFRSIHLGGQNIGHGRGRYGLPHEAMVNRRKREALSIVNLICQL